MSQTALADYMRLVGEMKNIDADSQTEVTNLWVTRMREARVSQTVYEDVMTPYKPYQAMVSGLRRDGDPLAITILDMFSREVNERLESIFMLQTEEREISNLLKESDSGSQNTDNVSAEAVTVTKRVTRSATSSKKDGPPTKGKSKGKGKATTSVESDTPTPKKHKPNTTIYKVVSAVVL